MTDENPTGAGELRDIVLRLVQNEETEELVDAFRQAKDAAAALLDLLVEVGYPVEKLTIVTPSIDEDGTPVVWVHVGNRKELSSGGAGPPPAGHEA